MHRAVVQHLFVGIEVQDALLNCKALTYGAFDFPNPDSTLLYSDESRPSKQHWVTVLASWRPGVAACSFLGTHFPLFP